MIPCLIVAVLIAGANGASSHVKRMVHGDYASIYDFPYQVYFGNARYICSGVIVSSKNVLTAAHCVQGNPEHLWVHAGSDMKNLGGTVHHVQNVVIHEKYALDDRRQRSSYDIAVVTVQEPFNWDATTQPIEMFRTGESIKPGMRSLVSGWGKLGKHHGYPEKLRKMSLVVVDTGACNRSYASWGGLQPGQICARSDDAYLSRSPCYGDSGSPLVIGGRLAGIFIYGGECELAGSPIVSSEVAYFRKWINRHIQFDDEYY